MIYSKPQKTPFNEATSNMSVTRPIRNLKTLIYLEILEPFFSDLVFLNFENTPHLNVPLVVKMVTYEHLVKCICI